MDDLHTGVVLFGGFLIVAVSLAIYVLPSIVAGARHKDNLVAITALNRLAGWTVVGWVVALVWALTHDREERKASRERRG